LQQIALFLIPGDQRIDRIQAAITQPTYTREHDMRRVTFPLRLTAAAWACSALLAGCGGGGDSGSGSPAQSLDFPYPGARYLANAPAPLSATASSGLAVTFSSNTPAVCTVTDGNLVPVSPGECSITATQGGSSAFAAATPAQQLFMVLKHPQAITFASPGFQALGTAPVSLAASADSGLAVSLSSGSPDVCTVNGATLTLVASGQCTITATQPGDSNYDAAAPATVVFPVGDAPPPVLTILSGFKSTSSSNEGGAVDGYAGSNKDGWWCSDANWCGSAISADGSSLTYHYSIQPNDPNHPNGDNWIGAYVGVEAVAAGVASISSTDNTTTGVQVDKQTTLKFGLGQNAEWFGMKTDADPHKADVKVTLVLGHFGLKNGNACNVALNAVVTPTAAATQSYELQLNTFTVSENCGLTVDAAMELTTYPIVKIKFDAVQANTSVSPTPDPNPPSYPTVITIAGGVTVQ
jgi:hypothetical protein